MPIRLTKTVKILMISCFAVFLIQQTADQFFGANLLGIFGLVPSGFVQDHRFWQLFTYAFLHADVLHLFMNLLMLAFIGGEIEAAWGVARFLRYYFFCSVSAGLFYLFLQVIVRGDLHTPMIGASGAIYGLLMAYGLMFGERVMLFMLLFPLKAKHFVWVLALIEFMTTVFSGRGGLASAAHLGGMAAGFGYLWAKTRFKLAKKGSTKGDRFGLGSQKAAKRKPKKKNHLKLIIDNEREETPDHSHDDDSQDPKTWH